MSSMRLLRSLLAAVAVLSCVACETFPKEIDGRPVIGTRWVKGKKVYILGEADDDKTAMKTKAAEAANASSSVVFKPLK